MKSQNLSFEQQIDNQISLNNSDYVIILKNNGNISSFVRYIYIRTKNGVVKMTYKRVDHKQNLKEDSICKNFWDEFAKRGFSVETSNDGTYHKNADQSQLIKDNNGFFELKTGLESKINIVSAQNFMKTISKIESMVSYKLFE
jgi:hypothetical protein